MGSSIVSHKVKDSIPLPANKLKYEIYPIAGGVLVTLQVMQMSGILVCSEEGVGPLAYLLLFHCNASVGVLLLFLMTLLFCKYFCKIKIK